jgi:hypothetical protein
MKYVMMLSAMLAVSEMAFGHCPLEVKIDSNTYCTDVEWLSSQQKINGAFTDSAELSPILILAGTIPPLWLHSTANFVFWKKGDAQHVPQEISGLRIFPYMHMSNGHHHSTAYEFSFNSTAGAYQLAKVAFTEMKGCWSLRWTTDTTDSLEASQLLLNVTAFTNVPNDLAASCEGDEGSGDEHEHHSH